MQSVFQTIEEAYRKKVSLFQDLLSCVTAERDDLIKVNIDNLWVLMEKKQKILQAIEEAKGQIKNLAEEDPAYQNAYGKERGRIIELSERIVRLKEEIKARVKENVTFIQESLQFVDEIISIFSMGGRLEPSYDPIRKHRKGFSAGIYQRQV